MKLFIVGCTGAQLGGWQSLFAFWELARETAGSSAKNRKHIYIYIKKKGLACIAPPRNDRKLFATVLLGFFLLFYLFWGYGFHKWLRHCYNFPARNPLNVVICCHECYSFIGQHLVISSWYTPLAAEIPICSMLLSNITYQITYQIPDHWMVTPWTNAHYFQSEKTSNCGSEVAAVRELCPRGSPGMAGCPIP